ncbi:hypothetical protein, partial [Kluyvera georgiana]|uniref:hypothetical protein n=1 Tax=Kluyvera georgiana TaxID=73098 RepID=UPI00322024DF
EKTLFWLDTKIGFIYSLTRLSIGRRVFLLRAWGGMCDKLRNFRDLSHIVEKNVRQILIFS